MKELVKEMIYIMKCRIQVLQRYKELQDVIAILGLEELCNQDRVIAMSL